MIKQKYNWPTEMAGRIWAAWALLLFVATLLIAMLFYWVCYLLQEPRAARWHRAVSNVWMTFYLTLIGCPLRVSGKENFKKGKNYVVVCNHNSLMDVPVTTPFMPNANKTIGKKEFAYTPLFGWIYSLGSVLVDRKSAESRKNSFLKMKKVLQLGLDMVIYPEGMRNKTVQPLAPFQNGAFQLAKDCNKSIIPALLFNTGKVMPAEKSFFLLPHRLYMHFLPPVSPGGLSVSELREHVFEVMWKYYEENESDTRKLNIKS